MTITDEIRNELESLADEKKADFIRKLTPGMSYDSVLGIPTPTLRDLAKKYALREDIEDFFAAVPHKYFEEKQLHSFIICLEKDFEKCLKHVEDFLPYIDNWATCDQLAPKVFKKKAELLLPYIDGWLASDETYTVRFGIGMLMSHFLDDRFDISYPTKVAKLRSNEYYINMEIAWYFATALAKQYDSILPFIAERRLDTWTHNKTIQKACESYRITDEQKAYLRTLKIKER